MKMVQTTTTTTVTQMGNCSNCQKWAKRKLGQTGYNQGLGKCLDVPAYFDATEESDGVMDGPDRGAVKAEYRGAKAFALDGSGYLAELLVAPDFGCISCAPISKND